MALHGTHGRITVIMDIRVFKFSRHLLCDSGTITAFSHERIEVYRGKFEHPTLNPLAEQTLYRTAPPTSAVNKKSEVLLQN